MNQIKLNTKKRELRIGTEKLALPDAPTIRKNPQ